MRELNTEEEIDCGVIVGRFQVHELTEGHVDLIQTVSDRHDKVIIILGLSPLMNTTKNPLDYDSRRQMILDRFPDVITAYVKDMADDAKWSKKVDEVIGDLVSPTQTAVLYGSRDSFVSSYSGKYQTKEMEATIIISASEVRKRLKRKVRPNADFRAGVAWASMNRYPTVFTTVDVAIFNEDQSKLLLARKPHEDLYRLVGGFADPRDVSFEAAARREVTEETGLAITDPIYVGSRRQDDWRYRGEVDKITTLLFKANIQFGRPTPMDDIEELQWFDDWRRIARSSIVPEHVELMRMLINSVDGTNHPIDEVHYT